MIRRVIFISWKPPPLVVVKVNFDGSFRGAKGGVEYVIWDFDGRMLATKGSFLFEPSVP